MGGSCGGWEQGPGKLTIHADRRPGPTLGTQGVVGEMAPKLVPWDYSPRYGGSPWGGILESPKHWPCQRCWGESQWVKVCQASRTRIPPASQLT